MSMFNFTATPYDSGVLLSWNVTGGESSSTTADLCHVTIQYSTDDYPHLIPNTVPYVVRDLEQNQYSSNILWHPHLLNGVAYTYTGFVVYQDTLSTLGPFVVGPVIPAAGVTAPLQSGSLSFSKLGTNTSLTGVKDGKTEVIIWLPESQNAQKTYIENTLNELKPAHTRINFVYEPYYVPYTTTAQFTSGSYASGSYTVSEGYIKNKVATIDYSFSGTTAIFGGL